MKPESIKIFHAVHPDDFKHYTTEQIRKNFVVSDLEKEDEIRFCYTHYDRLIAGMAKPLTKKLSLGTYDNLKSDYFLERRELGIINIAGKGKVTADGQVYDLDKEDCLFVGLGTKQVIFESADPLNPAVYYLLSAPAHKAYPTTFMKAEDATHFDLGGKDTCNERQLNRYIHKDGIQSCQLVMGVTKIKKGSVWNSVPSHTHDRRSELYFYFDLEKGNSVFHFMGEPQETRHVVLLNNSLVLSPSWSMHFGCATSNYSFIWGMAGENKEFTDMDEAAVDTIL